MNRRWNDFTGRKDAEITYLKIVNTLSRLNCYFQAAQSAKFRLQVDFRKERYKAK